MKRLQPLHLLCLLVLAAPPASAGPAGDLHVYLGDPTQGGRIATFEEGTGALLSAHQELRGLRLLPLDFNARLSQDEFLPGRPHWRGDIAGAGRIELPNAQGVLYRFQRVIPGADGRFGFLRIEADGTTNLIAERTGTGAGSMQDPYGDRIALAPDGASLLVATSVAAGGDLLEVDLITGAVLDRTPAMAPLDFRSRSLRLNEDWALAVSSTGVYRTTLAAGDSAELVALDAGTTHFTGELVLSPDRSRALTTAGTAADNVHAWVIPKDGPALRASRDPQPMSGAGFLPEALHGPFLAVANDGGLCAWRIEGVLSREVFVRHSSAPAAQAATHVTGTPDITDTLDEAGLLVMFQPGKLMMAVGEIGTDPGVGIEKADFFEVSLDAAGNSTLLNLSRTSGELTAPFLAIPELTPLFVRWLPAAQRYLMYDEMSGGTGRLLAFDPNNPGVQPILNDVKEVFFVECIGDTVIVSLRMDTGSKPHRIVRFPADLSTAPTVEYDAGAAELLQSVVDPSGWLAFRQVPEIGPQRMHIYDVAAHTLKSFPVSALAFGPVLAWTEGGDLSFSLDRGGLRYFAAWPRVAGAPYRLQAVAPEGALLPGR